MPIVNFGRNVTFEPTEHYQPKSESDVIEILDQHPGQRIRVIGRLHSWSKVIVGEEVVIDLRHLRSVRTFQEQDRLRAEVGAGCQIHELLEQLDQQQSWTLPSVGLIAQQSIAGAIATATHGSGGHALSNYVVAMRIARMDAETGCGKIETVHDKETLAATACSLGSVGVVLSVTLRCRQQYLIEEQFQEYERLDEVLEQESSYPLQQFFLVPWRWRWMAQHRREVLSSGIFRAWLYRWYRFVFVDFLMHVAILFSIGIVRRTGWTQQLFRTWLPLFIIRKTPVADRADRMLVMKHELFRHREIECFVRRSRLKDALSWVRSTLEVAAGTGDVDYLAGCYTSVVKNESGDTEIRKLAGSYCHHYPICVRRIRPDPTLMSMSSADPSDVSPEDWYSISVISYSNGKDQASFFQLADFLAKSMAAMFGARPHWGKLCPLTRSELETLYPRLDEFRSLARRFDPRGQFRNDWTAELLDR